MVHFYPIVESSNKVVLLLCFVTQYNDVTVVVRLCKILGDYDVHFVKAAFIFYLLTQQHTSQYCHHSDFIAHRRLHIHPVAPSFIFLFWLLSLSTHPHTLDQLHTIILGYGVYNKTTKLSNSQIPTFYNLGEESLDRRFHNSLNYMTTCNLFLLY